MLKVALAQALLRKMHEKQAGIGTKAAIGLGAGALGTAYVVGKGMNKAHEYKAGFQPGVNPHGGHQ